MSSCDQQPQANTTATILEHTYQNHQSLFDTLVDWGFSQTHGEEPQSFFIDQVTEPQKTYFLQWGIHKMTVQQEVQWGKQLHYP
jgi:hypothetical protein